MASIALNSGETFMSSIYHVRPEGGRFFLFFLSESRCLQKDINDGGRGASTTLPTACPISLGVDFGVYI